MRLVAVLALASGLMTSQAAIAQEPVWPETIRQYGEIATGICQDELAQAGQDQAIRLVDTLVCFYGPIDGQAARAFRALDLTGIEAIVVRSEGGSVASALDMIEHIGIGREITLVVDGLCASACANYLFLGVKWKIVPGDSRVLWHGAPPALAQWSPPPEMPPEAAAFQRATIERSEAFFRQIGLEDRVARETRDGRVIAIADAHDTWVRSRAELEGTYRIPGILMMP